MTVDRALLDEQIAYYRARAPEYDEWFLRVGRYDHGDEHRRAWFAEVAEVEAALRVMAPRERVLELACGTGLWTQHLVEIGGEITAVDAAPECLEANRRRVGSPSVRHLQADLFAWQPTDTFDLVFFGFWLSHVPPDRFDEFWMKVKAALRPGGAVFFVDSARSEEHTARDHRLPDAGEVVMDRRLNDGRGFRVVKVFYEPAALEARLQAAGWRGQVRSTERFFIYGCLQRDQTP